MKRVIIFGAGGHGREVADVLLQCVREGEAVEAVGFVDDNPNLHGRLVNGLPVLGGLEWFDGADRNDIRVVCAVGTPAVGRRLAMRAAGIGLDFINVISPRAYVSAFSMLGSGVCVFPHAVVQPQVRLGDHCILNVGATVSHDSAVGPYTCINPGARLAGNVSVAEGCYIGMGASIIQGRSIGAWTTIGAGAVVIRDVPPGVTAVGVPAVVISKNKPDDSKS